MASAVEAPVIRFGPYALEPKSQRLYREGIWIKLPRQSLLVLQMLLSRRGEVVTREELRAALWPSDTFVDFDHGLNNSVNRIRVALNDSAESPLYIETLPRVGYRFVGKVNGIVESLPVQTPADGMQPPAPVDRLPITDRAGRTRRVAVISAVLLLVLTCGVLLWNQFRTAPSVILTRITANSEEAAIDAFALSSDGKFVAYWDSTGLYVRDVQSRETHPLPTPATREVLPYTWLPDDVHFLATYVAPAPEKQSIWKLSIFGDSAQRLVENAGAPTPSPDGSRIAFLRIDPQFQMAPNTGDELWVMSAGGADPNLVLKAESGHWFSSPVWSPTGKHIAYLEYRGGPVSVEVALKLVDPERKTPVTVLSDAKIGPGLSWAGDGRVFYSYSVSSDQTDAGITATRIDEETGRVVGQVTRFAEGPGSIVCLNVTADGKKLGALRLNLHPQVFVGDLDEDGTKLNGLHRLTLDDRPNFPFSWTGDSKAVLFISMRNGVFNIFKQYVGKPTAELFVGGADKAFGPRLTPDGAEVLYLVMPREGGPATEVKLFRIPVAGGPSQLVWKEAGMVDIQCARAPSSQCIVTQLTPDGTVVFDLDPHRGKGRPLQKLPSQTNWSLSPNGSQLAMIPNSAAEARIQLVPIAGGSTSDIVVNGWTGLSAGDWSADGKSLFVSAHNMTNTNSLLKVSLDGNAVELTKGRLGWAIPSPDGRHVAVMKAAGENNIWMVEEF